MRSRAQWDDAFPVSAAAKSIASRSAAPASPPPSTAERGAQPIEYVDGPLAGLVVGNESELVQPYGNFNRRYVRDGNLMRWAKP